MLSRLTQREKFLVNLMFSVLAVTTIAVAAFMHGGQEVITQTSAQPATPPVCGDGHLDPGEQCESLTRSGYDYNCISCKYRDGTPLRIMSDKGDPSCGVVKYICLDYQDDTVFFTLPCVNWRDITYTQCLIDPSEAALADLKGELGRLHPIYYCSSFGNSCLSSVCGDGRQEGVEQCDDANEISGDGCSSTCQIEVVVAPIIPAPAPVCGNGITESTEQCDDGNTSNTDACLNICVLATCGDSNLRTGVEQCDDGNIISGDGCSTTCQIEAVVAPITPTPTPTPTPVPAPTPVCGNGTREGNEQCDDGNNFPGDGCSATCQAEVVVAPITPTPVPTPAPTPAPQPVITPGLPACSAAHYTCNSFSSCSAQGQQTRTCTLKAGVSCDANHPSAVVVETARSCTPAPIAMAPTTLEPALRPAAPDDANLRAELESLKAQLAQEQKNYLDKVRDLEARLTQLQAQNQILITQFRDVDNNPVYQDFTPFIARMRLLEVMKGNEVGDFIPQGNITKSELVVMLLRITGVDTAAFGANWQPQAARIARERNWINLGPADYNKPANRSEVMELTLKALNIPVTQPSGCFRDVDINHTRGAYICTAKTLGIITGRLDGTFGGGYGDFVSRAEVTKVVANASKEAVK